MKQAHPDPASKTDSHSATLLAFVLIVSELVSTHVKKVNVECSVVTWSVMHM